MVKRKIQEIAKFYELLFSLRVFLIPDEWACNAISMLMRLLLQNIRSITNNFSELEAFLAKISEPEVIALTETLLSKSPPHDYFSLKNYQNLVSLTRRKQMGVLPFTLGKILPKKFLQSLGRISYNFIASGCIFNSCVRTVIYKMWFSVKPADRIHTQLKHTLGSETLGFRLQ